MKYEKVDSFFHTLFKNMKPIGVIYHAHTFVRFCIVGIGNTGVDIVVYFVLTRFTGLGEFLVIAKICSYFIATLNSIYFNHTWTFRNTTPITIRMIIQYFYTVGLGVFINAGIHWFGLNILQMPDILSVLVAAAGTAVWGFAWARFFIFRV